MEKCNRGRKNCPLYGVTGCPLSEVAKYYSVLGDNWDFEDCPLYRRCSLLRGVR